MIGKVIISDILKITKLSSRVPDAGKKKKEILPEHMKDMQNGRQTTVLWTHKS